ncbi:hypothetical protein ACOME3_006512 [Neoechinorhynchus agilis]
MNLISNEEKIAVSNAALLNLRFDGRGIGEHRSMSFEFGIQPGTVLVSLGRTRVLAKTDCVPTVPHPFRPQMGKITVRLSFSTMSAPYFESGRYGQIYQMLRRQLDETARKSIVDVESLIIRHGKWCWELRIMVEVLNNDGNVFSCANLAMMASIRTARRNHVEIQEGDKIRIVPFNERQPECIQIISKPVAVVYAVMNNEKCEIIDPSYMEEKSSLGLSILIVTENSQIIAYNHIGKCETLPTKINELLQMSFPRAAEITNVIDEAVNLANSTWPRKEWVKYCSSATHNNNTVEIQTNS